MATNIDTIARATGARLSAQKAVLKAVQKRLRGGSERREAILIESLADPADGERSRTERDIAVQQLEHESGLLHDVMLALEKIEKKVYGVCETCEHPISEKRLDAVPWARLCFACQSKSEVAERMRSSHLKHTA